MVSLLSLLLCCFERESQDHNEVYAEGKKVYEQKCIHCHQSDGRGKQGIFPPLQGSQWITKDPKVMASIIQYGLGGEIDVAGITYRSAMPPQNLTKQDLYSVVAYVRFAFAKQRLDFSIETMTEIVMQERGTIFGQQELEELFP